MRRIVMVSCAVVVLGALFAAAPASAARWELLTMVQPEGASEAVLEEVSCTEIAVCTAVGNAVTEGTRSSLAERREGGAWRLQTLPTAREAFTEELHGISCTTECLAVGQYSTLSATFALAEVWNGTSWSLSSAARPPGSTGSVLWGVSCSAASACTAVGVSYNGGTGSAMAQRWNGTSWSLQTVPVPAGAVESELQGVACGSATGCIAVGRYTERSGAVVGLAMTWDGTTWTLRTIAPPARVALSQLFDVSCVGPSDCTAVGSSGTNVEGPQKTLAQRWNGREMTLQTTRDPAGSLISELRNVSCVTRTACTAVGYYRERGANYLTLAESWNGTEWAIQETPNFAGSIFNVLDGLSCRSEVCIAVGLAASPEEASSKPLGERYA